MNIGTQMHLIFITVCTYSFIISLFCLYLIRKNKKIKSNLQKLLSLNEKFKYKEKLEYCETYIEKVLDTELEHNIGRNIIIVNAIKGYRFDQEEFDNLVSKFSINVVKRLEGKFKDEYMSLLNLNEEEYYKLIVERVKNKILDFILNSKIVK
jgi:succinate dehydrogenase flavin-adding protein (antitoxin of CptAB toxin-antitoxin module)